MDHNSTLHLDTQNVENFSFISCPLLMVSGRGWDEGGKKISPERLSQYKGGRKKNQIFKKAQYYSGTDFNICQNFPSV